MKVIILGILSVVILASGFSLPTLADDSGSITITMTGINEISIELDKTSWDIGDVATNAVIETTPPIQWCTLTVTGNSDVNTLIEGKDAKWVDDPAAYEWTLSYDGSNGEHIYGLWFRISGDTTRGPNEDGYVPITKTQSEFWPYPDNGSPLEPDDTKQFGLSLMTPTYFYGSREMQTQVTISAVAA